ncbi:MAG: HD-GYP domain-containing protein [Lachnospiraceae bacterium]|nr:HD-GYP domain-containing protein [Lachnospiraceae bacterium]
MQVVNASQILPGMVLAEDVKTKSGQVIMDKGTVLNERLIARLDFYSISSITIESSEPSEPQVTEQPKAPDPEPQPSQQKFLEAGRASYSQKIQRSSKFRSFQVSYTRCVLNTKESFNQIKNGQYPGSSALLSSSLNVINEFHLNAMDLFDMLQNMRVVDDAIYAHCVNVACIVRVFGKWMKYDKERINLLTLAGLLHDIGKTMIPSSILDKQEKLTDAEYQICQMHTYYGYDLLKNLPVPKEVLSAAKSHHELCDGSGYPDHLKSDDIDDITLMVGVADIYDAMTAARSYRAPICPFTVIKHFEDAGLQKYRADILMTFLSHIAGTHLHNRVLLSDGSQATIMMLNEKKLSRPLVQFDDGKVLDLSYDRSLDIIQML